MIHLRNYKLFESVKDISYKEYKSLPNPRESFNEDEKKFIKKLSEFYKEDGFSVTYNDNHIQVTSEKLLRLMEPLLVVEKYDKFFVKKTGTFMKIYGNSYESKFTEYEIFKTLTEVFS